jgi:hypothetical protein
MYRMCLSKWREQDLEGAGSDNTMLLGRPGQSSLLAQNSLPRRCAHHWQESFEQQQFVVRHCCGQPGGSGWLWITRANAPGQIVWHTVS